MKFSFIPVVLLTMKKSKKAIAVRNPAALVIIKNQSLYCRFSLKVNTQKTLKDETTIVPKNNPATKTRPPIHVNLKFGYLLFSIESKNLLRNKDNSIYEKRELHRSLTWKYIVTFMFFKMFKQISKLTAKVAKDHYSAIIRIIKVLKRIKTEYF